MYFAHEKFDCYRVALGVARAVATLSIPAARKHLRDQVIRAADSMVLNVAEGLAREGDARRNHLRIALGSAAEVSAVSTSSTWARRPRARRCTASGRCWPS